MPPSLATSQYPCPDPVDAIPTIGELRRMAPVEPWNCTARAADIDAAAISTLMSAIAAGRTRLREPSTMASLVPTDAWRVNVPRRSFRYFAPDAKDAALA